MYNSFMGCPFLAFACLFCLMISKILLGVKGAHLIIKSQMIAEENSLLGSPEEKKSSNASFCSWVK